RHKGRMTARSDGQTAEAQQQRYGLTETSSGSTADAGDLTVAERQTRSDEISSDERDLMTADGSDGNLVGQARFDGIGRDLIESRWTSESGRKSQWQARSDDRKRARFDDSEQEQMRSGKESQRTSKIRR
ncbi:unnamed protein product, partial [Citrullus colocynthis]